MLFLKFQMSWGKKSLVKLEETVTNLEKTKDVKFHEKTAFIWGGNVFFMSSHPPGLFSSFSNGKNWEICVGVLNLFRMGEMIFNP